MADKDYKIAQVGPTKAVSFNGSDGNQVNLTEYSLLLEGEQNWCALLQKPDAPAPKIGDTLNGHIEPNDKYGDKFKKAKKGGSWGGGGKASPGAIYSAAQGNAINLLVAISTVSPDTVTKVLESAAKGKISETQAIIAYVGKLTEALKKQVDTLAGTETKKEEEKKEAAKPATESGESPAADEEEVSFDDIEV